MISVELAKETDLHAVDHLAVMEILALPILAIQLLLENATIPQLHVLHLPTSANKAHALPLELVPVLALPLASAVLSLPPNVSILVATLLPDVSKPQSAVTITIHVPMMLAMLLLDALTHQRTVTTETYALPIPVKMETVLIPSLIVTSLTNAPTTLAIQS
jgi:hypothetical protein